MIIKIHIIKILIKMITSITIINPSIIVIHLKSSLFIFSIHESIANKIQLKIRLFILFFKISLFNLLLAVSHSLFQISYL